jgi:hypothetical protein
VLSVHLAQQKISMIDRGIMEFIHPVEREQARKDLTAAIAKDDLQGSVTRMRFARLSRIRLILGCAPDDLDLPPTADLIAEDQDWMVLDMVLNWVRHTVAWWGMWLVLTSV